MEWTLADIKNKVRKLTGRPDASQLADADLLDYINEAYVNVLPVEVNTKDVESWFTLSVTEALGGAYDKDSTVFRVRPGALSAEDSDGVVHQMNLYTDYDFFFSLYPDDNDTTGRPQGMLLYDNKWYVRPLPDAAYSIKFPCTLVISPLADSTDKPLDPAWGPFIAYTAAIDILVDSAEDEQAGALEGRRARSLHQIAKKQTLQDPVGKRAIPRF